MSGDNDETELEANRRELEKANLADTSDEDPRVEVREDIEFEVYPDRGTDSDE